MILINGGKKLEDEVKKIMLQFSKNDHIFNLSHGIMPITPLDNVQKTLDTIKKALMKPDNHIKIPKKKLGVLMVNLGTPEKTDFINMWKYLREFLSDKRIIELTRLIWYPILYGIILMVRPGKSGKLYKSIWDKKK